MSSLIRTIMLLATVSVGGGIFPGISHAAYPERTVRIIAPFPPGGGVDVVARIIAQALSDRLRQQVIVDNRPGATGRIGMEIAAKAAPDGYTLLLGAVGTNAIVPAAYRNLPYDVVNDFAAISLVTLTSYALVVHPSLPVYSVQGLITLAKARPGELAYASAGSLSGAHLSGELINQMANINMLHVSYKGAAPAMTAVLGGQVALTFAAFPGAMPHVYAGRLRALGVTGARRASALPKVPAIGETVKGFDVTQWYSLFAPAGTPRDIIGRLHAETVKAIETPVVNKQFVDMGTEPTSSTPGQLAIRVKSEIEKWSAVIKRAGIKAE
ncbi:MAG: tripartite tricarboxylate transporter substrate binding protein [Burkholderiales bacterium]|nr:tripartite tricarboxylate transporter substrate binding protein [Burkholderiales bacterium]